MKGHVADMERKEWAWGAPAKFKSSATTATKESTNSTVIKQQRDIAAYEAALEHLGTKQQFGYSDHATIYHDNFAECVEDAQIHTINASVAPAPITEYPEYDEYPLC